MYKFSPDLKEQEVLSKWFHSSLAQLQRAGSLTLSLAHSLQPFPKNPPYRPGHCGPRPTLPLSGPPGCPSNLVSDLSSTSQPQSLLPAAPNLHSYSIPMWPFVSALLLRQTWRELSWAAGKDPGIAQGQMWLRPRH